MALLSRTVDYALLILSYLHHRAEGESARGIADRLGLSPAFVANILKRLCHGGFLASRRGAQGGYTLLRPADQIHLADLMDALDEPFQLAECCAEAPPGEGCVVLEACPLKGAIVQLHGRIRSVLAAVTLADLLPEKTAPGPEPVQLEVTRCRNG